MCLTHSVSLSSFIIPVIPPVSLAPLESCLHFSGIHVIPTLWSRPVLERSLSRHFCLSRTMLTRASRSTPMALVRIRRHCCEKVLKRFLSPHHQAGRGGTFSTVASHQEGSRFESPGPFCAEFTYAVTHVGRLGVSVNGCCLATLPGCALLLA